MTRSENDIPSRTECPGKQVSGRMTARNQEPGEIGQGPWLIRGLLSGRPESVLVVPGECKWDQNEVPVRQTLELSHREIITNNKDFKSQNGLIWAVMTLLSFQRNLSRIWVAMFSGLQRRLIHQEQVPGLSDV